MIPKELEGCESIILGEFAKLRKEIVDFDMSLSLSLSLSLSTWYNSATAGRIFGKF